jgi:hypothetical protein
VHPAGDPVGSDQAVRDLRVLAPRQRAVEGVVHWPIVSVHRRVPVGHLGVGLRAAEQSVAAGALKQLLHLAVGVPEREVDVGADHIQEAGEAVAGLVKAGGGLLARGDVGDNALDAHAAVGQATRAGAIAQNPRGAVQAGHAIRHLGVLAVQQGAVERRVLRPVRGRDARLPESSGVDLGRGGAADQALDGRHRREVHVAPVRGDRAGVDVLLEQVEDPGQHHLPPAPAPRVASPERARSVPQAPNTGRARRRADGGHG